MCACIGNFDIVYEGNVGCCVRSHVASTAAGNFGVPVVVDGFFYGRASGMAPRARFNQINPYNLLQYYKINLFL